MIRLMIVDDEKKTREGLLHFIPWKDMGIDEVLTSEDGTYALEICKNTPPNILLTDVSMPKMDGIRLAELVRAQFPDCIIIFLSGYSDKEYLMSAISLKALSYIEKPVDQEEVASAVQNAVNQIKMRMLKKSEDELLKTALNITLPVLMQQTALNLTYPDFDEQAIKRDLALLNTGIDENQQFTSLAIKLFRHFGAADKDIEQSNTLVLNHLFEYAKTSDINFLSGFAGRDQIIIHVQGKLSMNSYDSQQILDTFAEEIKKAAASCSDIAIGVGTAAATLFHVRTSGEHAEKALRKCFYTGRSSINYTLLNDEKFVLTENNLAAFDEIVSAKSRKAVNDYISGLTLQIMRYTATDPDYIKGVYVKLLTRFNNSLGNKCDDALNEDGDSIGLWKKISGFQTVSEIETYFYSYVDQYYEIYEDGTNTQGKVTDIKRFIRQNYSNPELSVKQIAENLYLCHTYMCYIFKKVTGKTINQYITEVRISAAKELLKDRSVKMYEISDKSGYKSQNYFTRLFKEQTGLTPSEYKERFL